MRDWNIRQIEALREHEASALSLGVMEIKDHHVYFVDFGGYFGYSALVYMNGHHIHYANEYELHCKHMHWTQDEMRTNFIEELTGKLFTEDEITGPVANYDEYKAKGYFLNNYYGMRRDHVSIFGYVRNEDERRAFNERIANMTYDPVCFAYFDDPAFVKHHCELYGALQEAWEKRQGDYDIIKTAFIREMYNHEYAINWQADWDTLSAFGNITYHDGDYADELQDYFDQLKFTETQRQAYMDARREYLREAGEGCC